MRGEKGYREYQVTEIRDLVTENHTSGKHKKPEIDGRETDGYNVPKRFADARRHF